MKNANPLRGRGTTVNNGRLDTGVDGSTTRAKGLDFGDHLHALGISDLTEDNMLAIEPRGDNGGDEELGTIAGTAKVSKGPWTWMCMGIGEERVD